VLNIPAGAGLSLTNSSAGNEHLRIMRGNVGAGQQEPVIHNRGTITTSGNASTRLEVGLSNHSTGQLNIAAATLHKSTRPLINDGLLGGLGTLQIDASPAGLLVNNGTFAPALPGETGTFTIAGRFPMASSATLDIELGGPGAAEFDRLLISGEAALSGVLRITLVDGYVPQSGETFDVMTFGSRSGDFVQIQGLDLGSGKVLQTEFLADRLRLTVTDE
jgi:hypothetical protein